MGLEYRWRIVVCLAVATAAVPLASRGADAQSAAARQPIIDMHFHAPHGPPAETRKQLFQKLDRYDVVLTALFVNDTAGAVWHRIDPDRLLVGAAFPCYGSGGDPANPCFAEGNGWPDLGWLRAQYQAGSMRLMGELKYVYYGIPPTDPRLEPYWALAEELDIPVGIHSGRGPYVRRQGCCPHFNDDLANPALLEPVLARHPKLRIWLMHEPGWDYVDEALALMKAHPNVYADMSILNSVMPVGQYRAHLKAVADAGLLDRIMFGSDNEPLGPIIERINAVPFLTEQQKRGIYCENAARFLRLDPEICTPGSERTPRTRTTAEAVIDMHLHAVPPGRGRTVDQMLQDMDRNGVVRALLMVNDTAIGPRWRRRAPDRFLVSADFPCEDAREPNGGPCFAAHGGWPDTAWLRREYESGRLAAMGEVINVYSGIAPGDPRLEPYWAIAEKFDAPVIIHIGRRPRASLPSGCCPNYNDQLGNPALLEPVLRRHPRLRISLAHAGQAFLDQTIALMKRDSNVYADISVVNSTPPEQRYAAVMRAYRDAGVLDRIMYGSDNEPYARTIARTDSLSFLSEAERRGIYCENAARFLRLDASVCANPQ